MHHYLTLYFFRFCVVPVQQRRVEVPAAMPRIGTDGTKDHLRALLIENYGLTHNACYVRII